MSCYICGTPMDMLTLDPRDMKTKPCSTCNHIIAETAGLDDEDDDFVAYLDSDVDEYNEILGKGSFDYD